MKVLNIFAYYYIKVFSVEIYNILYRRKTSITCIDTFKLFQSLCILYELVRN